MRTPRESLEHALANPIYVDISDWAGVRVDLRYGSVNNLLGRDVYGGFQRALLHKIAAEKFAAALQALQKARPDLEFLVYDALRPRSAQYAFWDLVKNTPQQMYFTDPAKGSVHNHGFALDVGLAAKKSGAELDMGTPFDDLTDLAQPRYEDKFLADGRLHESQRQNRLLLRRIMEGAGFEQLPHEWWHYDALPAPVVRANYPILE